MTITQAFILGCVEGLTEFLPISSTGHMIIVAHFLKIPTSTLLATFEIVIQLGAILAVIVTYYKKFLKLDVLKKISVAFISTVIVVVIIFPYI